MRDTDLFNNRGACYLNKGELEKAIKAFQAAYGSNQLPTFTAVQAYDAIQAAYRVLEAQRGTIEEQLAAQASGEQSFWANEQKQFDDKESLGMPLLSDPDRTVGAQLGAKRNFGPLKTKRVTYVIDTDRKLLDVINSEVSMSTHADKALALLKSRAN